MEQQRNNQKLCFKIQFYRDGTARGIIQGKLQTFLVRLLSSTCHPNEEYLVSHRICHAIVCCRMVPVPYTRFSNTAGIGCISKEKRKTFHESHKESVEHVYNESIEEALMEEMGMHEALDRIDITIDATHGW